MSGSVAEVQQLADQLLELLGVRMRAGQLVIHFSEGRVQKCETNTVHHPQRQSLPLRKTPLDAVGLPGTNGHGKIST